MTSGFFIQYLADDPVYFVCVVFAVIFSITVHELAHGYAATFLGDRTPRASGHLTIDPLVHMGPWSLFMLAMFGIAWGRMPIDPSRLRGRYAEALVAAAGPASNLLMAMIALTIVGVWYGTNPLIDQPGTLRSNALFFLKVFGQWNLALCVFNLLPIPPLDGAHIVANFSRKYARFIGDPAHDGLLRLLFMFAFVLGGVPAYKAMHWGTRYVEWVAGQFLL